MNPAADEIKVLKEERGALKSQLVVGISEQKELAIHGRIIAIDQQITALYHVIASQAVPLLDIVEVDMLPVARLVEIAIAPRLTSASSTRVPRFRADVAEFYNASSCIVLSSIFPRAAAHHRRWTHEQGLSSYFPWIAAHIYPHAQKETAVQLRIEIDDAMNGLPLMKCVEKRFDDGTLCFVPSVVTALNVTITVLVSREIQDEWLVYEDTSTRADKQNVLDEHGRKICFGQLHKKTVVISPKPFLRCLLLKQYSAQRAHPEEFDKPDATILGACKDPAIVREWFEKMES